jgi:hypothetical protein
MPRVGFEPTIPASKIVHVLANSAAVTGIIHNKCSNIWNSSNTCFGKIGIRKIREDITRRSGFRDVCYYSVRNIRSSCVKLKNAKTYMYEAEFLLSFYTWSERKRGKHRLRVFENRVLRRIFGQQRDEATGGRWKIQNEGEYNFYSSQNIIRVMKLWNMRKMRNIVWMRDDKCMQSFDGNIWR